MNFVWAVFRRELKSYFVSPLAYTAMAVFVAFQGVLFFMALGQYESLRLRAASNPLLEVPGGEMIVRSFLGQDLIWTLLVIVPLLTMRLLAEEKKQHTAELLLTAPMTTRHLVLGKFFGACAVLAVMLAITTWMPTLLLEWGHIDPAPMISGYLGAFLYGALLLALGLLASSLTDSSMIAAFLALAMVALVNLGGVLAVKIPFIGENLEQFTPSANLNLLARGVIDTQPLVFFAAAIIFVLDLTSRVVDSQRWR
ncbi:MAG TPA: hypothetical protein ENK10_09800 [Acidobacteria bacterium]|nr:hypothetical protein [Acidobacteriota bacterium]